MWSIGLLWPWVYQEVATGVCCQGKLLHCLENMTHGFIASLYKTLMIIIIYKKLKEVQMLVMNNGYLSFNVKPSGRTVFM